MTMLNLYWRLIGHPYRKQIALIGIGTLLAGLAEIAGIAMVIPIVALFLGESSSAGTALVPWLEAGARALGLATTPTRLLGLGLAIVFVLILLKSALVLGLNYLTALVAKGAQRDLTRRMYLSFAGAPYLELARRSTGETVETIRRPPDMVNYVIYQSGQAVAAAGQLLMTLLFLAWLAPVLVLVAGGLGGGVIVGFWAFLKKRRAELGRLSLSLDQRKMGMLVETFTGIRDVKVLNLLPRLSARLDAFLAEHVLVEVRALQYDQLPKIVFELGGLLILVLMIGLSLAVPALRLEFPVVAAIVLAIRQMTPAVSTLSVTIMKAAQESRQLEVIEETLTRLFQEEDRGADAAVPAKIDMLRFEGVTFSYPERSARPAIHDLSLSFALGKVTALVGGTGAGKTTIVNLIIRLIEPTAGRITADGADIRRFSLAGWRRQIGYVGQDVFLFNATLRENIASLDDGVPMSEIERAAKLAQIHDFITGLPDGYETTVGDRGVKLSGGQRQRIAVARAILKRPQILILDEATSALDNLTERALHEAIDCIRREAIVILIAHRLSTVEDADEILVLEGGRVVEQGSHDVLMARQGLYRRLYTATPDSLPAEKGPVHAPKDRA